MFKNIQALVLEAGVRILEIYRSGDFATELKADHSPLTRADKLSHEILSSGLARIGPGRVLSEEHPIPYEMRKDWDDYWLIDPLDGTKDFIDQNDEFTINVALMKNKRPVLGIIYAPAIEAFYHAALGEGAYFHSPQGPLRLPTKRTEEHTALLSRFHDSEGTRRFVEMNGIRKTIPAGSALKFCLLARGDANLYPRWNGSKEWDIAAGHLIVTEAGGTLMDLTTREAPRYNKPDLRNAFFLAVSGGLDIHAFSLPEDRS